MTWRWYQLVAWVQTSKAGPPGWGCILCSLQGAQCAAATRWRPSEDRILLNPWADHSPRIFPRKNTCHLGGVWWCTMCFLDTTISDRSLARIHVESPESGHWLTHLGYPRVVFFQTKPSLKFPGWSCLRLGALNLPPSGPSGGWQWGLWLEEFD